MRGLGIDEYAIGSLKAGLGGYAVQYVASSYVLAGDTIREGPRADEGQFRAYAPFAHVQPLFDLANVSGSEELLAFTQKWGMLIEWSEQSDLADHQTWTVPVNWAIAHSHGLRIVLMLLSGARKAGAAGLAKVVEWFLDVERRTDEHFVQYAGPQLDSITVADLNKRPPGMTLERLGADLVTRILGENLRSTSPFPMWSPSEGRFLLNLVGGLRESIYWHALQLATGATDIGVCEGCGSFFRREDKRQRFCPRADGTQGGESLCAIRERDKRRRRRPSSSDSRGGEEG